LQIYYVSNDVFILWSKFWFCMRYKLVYGWVDGKHVCVDLTWVLPFVGLGVGAITVGHAHLKVVSSKVVKHEKACLTINMFLYHLLLIFLVS